MSRSECDGCGEKVRWYLVMPKLKQLKCSECGIVYDTKNEGAQKSGRVSVGGRR